MSSFKLLLSTSVSYSILNKLEAMNLPKGSEGYMEEFEERRRKEKCNYIIISTIIKMSLKSWLNLTSI